ncbi:MAG: hypothetical protein LLG08_00590 [Actinomycetia bacterium]|nr:hypothetical protein [Actinomycetes bacterium]
MRIPLRDDPTRALTHDELVAQAMQYLEYRGWLVLPTHDARHRPLVPGITDIIAMRRARNLLLEIKTAEDELREDQVAFADRAIARGLEVHVVRSFEELTDLMHRI